MWLRKHKLSLLQPHVEYQQQWWHPIKKEETRGNLARFPTPLLLEESGLETLSGENHASDEMAELVQEKRKCKNNKQKYKIRHLAEKIALVIMMWCPRRKICFKCGRKPERDNFFSFLGSQRANDIFATKSTVFHVSRQNCLNFRIYCNAC